MIIREILEHMTNTSFEGDQNRFFAGFSLDSRTVKKADLFFALDGQAHRAIDFIAEIMKKKASCVVAEKKYAVELSVWKGKIDIIFVGDIMTALREAATWYKSLFNVITVGVTGSNGKTTTKELIADLLSTHYRVHKNEKNFNNEIGVPLTIFGLKKQHQMLVAELGINHVGEMDRLASIVRPDFAVITNIGATHLEYLIDEETVAREKARMLVYATKKVFLNTENSHLSVFSDYPLRKVFIHPDNKETSYHFDSIEPLGVSGYRLVYRGIKSRFSLYGMHNLDNLIMAIAVAQELGVPVRKIMKAIGSIRSIESRAAIHGNKRLTLIDESYNSNYSSLTRSLSNLTAFPGYICKAVVIGEMKELGAASEISHAKIGRQLSEMELNQIYLVGEQSKMIADNYTGAAAIEVFGTYKDAEAAIVADLENCGGPMVMLVKGSRGNRLDELVRILIKKLKLKVGRNAV